MEKARGRKKLVLLVSLAILTTHSVSCTRQASDNQANKSAGKTGVMSTPEQVPSGARTGVKKSAGAVIYGEPDRIEIYVYGRLKTIKPEDKQYDDIRDAGERVLLRTSHSAAGAPAVNDKILLNMITTAPAAIRFIYKKAPTFPYFESRGYGKESDIPGVLVDLRRVTFFVPEDIADMQPDTMYDGYFYGNVQMVSTLTNADLVNLVKDFK